MPLKAARQNFTQLSIQNFALLNISFTIDDNTVPTQMLHARRK